MQPFPFTKQLSEGAFIESTCFLCLGVVGCDKRDRGSPRDRSNSGSPDDSGKVGGSAIDSKSSSNSNNSNNSNNSIGSSSTCPHAKQEQLIGELRLGCRCGVHYECLISYIRSSLEDRSVLHVEGAFSIEETSPSTAFIRKAPIGGLTCPYGPSCRLFISKSRSSSSADKIDQAIAAAASAAVYNNTNSRDGGSEDSSTPVYYITPEDMDGIVEYGMMDVDDDNGNTVRVLNPILTKRLQDINCKALTHDEVNIIRGWMSEVSHKVNTCDFDPYVLATTKSCPTCKYPSSHYHGHQCHYISPVTRGCPNCHVGYCYKCLSTDVENMLDRGSDKKCKCGFSHNFCIPFKNSDHIKEHLRINEFGIPYDSRCGCIICPDCRQNKPCRFCPGDCAVCKGIISPGPSEANPKVKWDPFKRAPANVTGSKKHDLWECCREGDVPALVNLIQTLKAESASDNTGNDSKISEILNSQDQEGKTPLMMAVDTSIIETVEALLTHGGTVIDVNKGNTQLETPLHVACSNGSVEIIKLLLKHPNIDVNRENAAQYTALYHSIAFGRVEVVNILLAHPNIDVNKADRFGESYLFFCCSNRSWEIAKLLIKHPDIDVNSASLMTSQTSLMIACEYDDLATVKCLMDHPKINPDLVDAFGRSARDYIAISNTHAVPISILVRSGGGLTSKDTKKKDDCIAS